MNKRSVRILGTEDQSLRVRPCRTQEELAKNLRQMGWPIIWKNARSVEKRIGFPFQATQPLAQFSLGDLSVRDRNATFRAESESFDLAADFLYSIVISVDLTTFQARDILPSSVCTGIDKHFSCSGDCHVTH
jgi:hypothetical protein